MAAHLVNKVDDAIKKLLKDKSKKQILSGIKANFLAMRKKNIENANQIDEILKEMYKTMTPPQKALKDAVDLIVESYDDNKDGMLSMKEFTQWFNNLQDSKVEPECIENSFKSIDSDEDKFINKLELYEFLNKMQTEENSKMKKEWIKLKTY